MKASIFNSSNTDNGDNHDDYRAFYQSHYRPFKKIMDQCWFTSHYGQFP